jgi:WD40 repeat protein
MAGKQSLSFALEPRATIGFDDYVADVAWSSDGRRLALAGGEGKVALVNAVAERAGIAAEIETVGEHLLGTLAVAWQPHGRRFATSGQDGTVALWDSDPVREYRRWKPAMGATQGLAYSPDGALLATATGKSVALWTAEGEKVHAFAPAASTAIALAFDKSGTDLGVALNGEVAVHRVGNSRYETRRYKWSAPCLTVNFSGNGRFLASGMADGTLHFWNRSTGKDSQMRGYDGKVQLVAWSDHSRYLASCTGNDVVLWDFSGRGPEGSKPVVLSGHTDRVEAFAWQPGGEHFVTGGRDWRIALWRPGKARDPLDVHMADGEISALRWSPDGRRVAIGEKGGRVTLMELVSR